MSQPPSRGGPYGGWTPTGRPSAPSPFRPASPYSPTPYQQQPPAPAATQQRGPPMGHHTPGLGMVHPMSPVPMMPMSPGMSPVFGHPPASFIQCPRPRWPSPLSPGNATARPFVPVPQVRIMIITLKTPIEQSKIDDLHSPTKNNLYNSLRSLSKPIFTPSGIRGEFNYFKRRGKISPRRTMYTLHTYTHGIPASNALSLTSSAAKRRVL